MFEVREELQEENRSREDCFNDDGKDPDEKTFSEKRKQNQSQWLVDLQKRIANQKQR